MKVIDTGTQRKAVEEVEAEPRTSGSLWLPAPESNGGDIYSIYSGRTKGHVYPSARWTATPQGSPWYSPLSLLSLGTHWELWQCRSCLAYPWAKPCSKWCQKLMWKLIQSLNNSSDGRERISACVRVFVFICARGCVFVCGYLHTRVYVSLRMCQDPEWNLRNEAA